MDIFKLMEDGLKMCVKYLEIMKAEIVWNICNSDYVSIEMPIYANATISDNIV